MLLRNAFLGVPFRRRLCGTRRTIYTETVQTLSNAFLDLSIALPYPPTWPPYASTIILVGVVSRLALVPVFIWSRSRNHRVEESVIPHLKAYRTILEAKSRHEIPRSNGEASRDHFSKIMSSKLKKKRDELFKAHRCTPWVTILVPTAVQFPIYIVFSTVIYNATAGSDSVIRDEAFFTMSSLAYPDPTLTLPIMFGLVSLASVETAKLFSTEEQVRRSAAQEKKADEQRARGKFVIHSPGMVKTIVRGLSVGRIVLAAMMPGSMEVYWVTSATFALFQNWVFIWDDHRRDAARKLQNRNGVAQHHQTPQIG